MNGAMRFAYCALRAGFTKTYGVVMLVYYEEYSSILEARAREATLKR
jgi:predicted GIY-YIG superfamily endonuclease